jgi:serralysin
MRLEKMSQASSLERQMLELINQERATVGVAPLQLEIRLNASSEDYSKLMLQQNFFSHTGPDNSSARGRMEDAGFVFSGNWASGENIAWQSERGAAGLADDVVNLHNSLMNSSGHRANILNPNFEVIGIGIESGDYKGWDAVMVTQNFAKTGASVQIDGSYNSPTPPVPAPAPFPSGPLFLTGTHSSDTLTGTGGNDTIQGAGGADRIKGGGGHDNLWGNDGNDNLRGQTGNDEIGGGDGSDKIFGHAGNDTIYGAAGNDTVYGGGGKDKISAGTGSDSVYGNGGNDEIDGGDGRDHLRAGGGKDIVLGGAGDDNIWGDNGGDTLDGGADNDTLQGGGGADVFIFSTGNDLVVDFEDIRFQEKIDLSSVDTISNFFDLQINHLYEVNGNAVIDDGLGNTMTLQGLDSSALDSGDFLF